MKSSGRLYLHGRQGVGPLLTHGGIGTQKELPHAAPGRANVLSTCNLLLKPLRMQGA